MIEIQRVPWRRGDTPQWDGYGWHQATKGTTGQIWQMGSNGLWGPVSLSSIDHGSLGGLADDDHTQYLKESDFDDIDFLVGTATGHTAAEIVVGTTPGGELGGTWASPTVDATHSGSAHHAQVHGAADHTDRTRRFYVPARLFWSSLTGTPAYASVGAANVNAENWAMDGTADEAIGTLVQMPADWAGGTITPYFVWAPSDATVGNVAWICRVTSIAAGEAFNQALESTSGTVVAAAGGVQYGTNFTSMGSIAPGTGAASALLRILAYRFASDASDTYNALDALFLGMYVEYTADS